jgi:hypothetical protein
MGEEVCSRCREKQGLEEEEERVDGAGTIVVNSTLLSRVHLETSHTKGASFQGASFWGGCTSQQILEATDRYVDSLRATVCRCNLAGLAMGCDWDRNGRRRPDTGILGMPIISQSLSQSRHAGLDKNAIA